MMVSGVEKAEVAAISNYRVAGKTGTAYVPDFKKGGYTDEVINTYIGFAPADNPQFVILLRIDKPKGAPLSGLSVVPAFKELAQFVLNYYNIPPDKLAISQ
jgi:cell division protein FtsI/penicillin-binding protein 2